MIVLKNIDLSKVDIFDQIFKVEEENKEFWDAIKDGTKEQKIEEFWDSVQAKVGLLEKYGISAKDINEGYQYHLQKIKNRPRFD